MFAGSSTMSKLTPPPPSCYRHCTAVWLVPSAQPLIAVSLAAVTAGPSVFVKGHMMRTARWRLLTALHWSSWNWTVWCHHQSVTPDTHGAVLSRSESFRVPNLAASIYCTVVLSAHSFYWEGMFITFANLYKILLSSTSCSASVTSLEESPKFLLDSEFTSFQFNEVILT